MSIFAEADFEGKCNIFHSEIHQGRDKARGPGRSGEVKGGPGRPRPRQVHGGPGGFQGGPGKRGEGERDHQRPREVQGGIIIIVIASIIISIIVNVIVIIIITIVIILVKCYIFLI